MTETEQLQLFADRAAPVGGWPKWEGVTCEFLLECEYTGARNNAAAQAAIDALPPTGGRARVGRPAPQTLIISRPKGGMHWSQACHCSLHEAIALCEHHMREWLDQRGWEIRRGLTGRPRAWADAHPRAQYGFRRESQELSFSLLAQATYFEALVAAVQAAGKETT